MFSAMSYGSISYNAHESLARAAEKLGTYYNTGEGGLHQDFYKYGEHTIVQVASGRFGVNHDYLNAGAAIEIKMGQGAKPGIGGHLPGRKIVADIAKTRMIPEGSDAISPAPHHDIYSIEDLRQLVFSLKEASRYTKPVIVKIAAVHNVAAIASGIARSGADIIAIDGISVSEYIHPMLTTLCQPMTAMGEASVEILLDIIEGRGVHRHVTLPTALREGASVRQPKHRFSRGNPRENKFEKEY